MGKYKGLLPVAVFVALIAAAVEFLHGRNIAVLNPAGIIASQERHLIIVATLLMLVVVIPVFVMAFGFAWRYRESNHQAVYMPELDHGRIAETVWWLVPGVLIFILSIITWQATHQLDPYKPLASTTKPLTVQVVALDWKWLFIYPEQGIATINYLQLPNQTPVDFVITADGPMNSLWIPQLGGQIYAMPGMNSHLQLMADKVGNYYGSSANISGKGFAGMHFMTHVTTAGDFHSWATALQHSTHPLNTATYPTLAKPSENNPAAYYKLADYYLYDKIVLQYMTPTNRISL